jgi:hypothetical protein
VKTNNKELRGLSASQIDFTKQECFNEKGRHRVGSLLIECSGLCNDSDGGEPSTGEEK